MKTKILLLIIPGILLLAVTSQPLQAQVPRIISYQGRISDTNGSVSGSFQMQFVIYDASSGPNLLWQETLPNIAVTNGIFSVMLGQSAPLDATIFQGDARWLEIALRPAGNTDPFTVLSPRQFITAVPYAITAGNLTGAIPSSALNGTYSGQLEFSNAGNSFHGRFTGDGSGLAGVTLNGLGAADFWQLRGNAGTVPTLNFLGTIDKQVLELRVNNERALRLEPTAYAPNIILGTRNNSVLSGIRGATIGGGGLISDAELYFGGASPNQISAHYGVIGGGLGNVAGEAAPIANPLEEPPPQYNHNFHDGAYYITNGIASGVLTGVGNHARGHYSSIGGGFSNRIERFNESAFIGGGQENSIRDVSFPTEGGVQYFLVTGATISGGSRNTVQGGGNIAGGYGNSTYGGSIGGGSGNRTEQECVVAGGTGNTNNGYANSIGGGELNLIQWSKASAIAGGASNLISLPKPSEGLSPDFGHFGTIGGGSGNIISNKGDYATIPGGYFNKATGFGSFAAGSHAEALHDGAFVWADNTETNFTSTGANQYCIRASGGVFLNTNTSVFFGSRVRQMLNLWSTQYGIGVQDQTFYCRSFADFSWYRQGVHNDARNNPGGGIELMRLDLNGNLRTLTGTIAALSDRNAKTNFAAINARDILDRVASLPIATWNYKNHDPSQRHIGPTAQDFYAAFRVGLDEKSICTVDADGVALAAIQGLNQNLEEKEARIAALEKRLEKLEKLLVVLTQNADGK